jgi:hypothetical protein
MYVKERKNGIYLLTHYARKLVGGVLIMTGDMKSAKTTLMVVGEFTHAFLFPGHHLLRI